MMLVGIHVRLQIRIIVIFSMDTLQHTTLVHFRLQEIPNIHYLVLWFC